MFEFRAGNICVTWRACPGLYLVIVAMRWFFENIVIQEARMAAYRAASRFSQKQWVRFRVSEAVSAALRQFMNPEQRSLGYWLLFLATVPLSVAADQACNYLGIQPRIRTQASQGETVPPLLPADRESDPHSPGTPPHTL